MEPDTLAALADAPFDLLEQAKGGLLFLKEIGDLNRLAQKGLLLLLGKLEKYSVRLVCATSIPLADLAAQGVYDPRLYEILSSLCINVPALREHREDIPELANQILSRYIESGEDPGAAIQHRGAQLLTKPRMARQSCPTDRCGAFSGINLHRRRNIGG